LLPLQRGWKVGNLYPSFSAVFSLLRLPLLSRFAFPFSNDAESPNPLTAASPFSGEFRPYVTHSLLVVDSFLSPYSPLHRFGFVVSSESVFLGETFPQGHRLACFHPFLSSLSGCPFSFFTSKHSPQLPFSLAPLPQRPAYFFFNLQAVFAFLSFRSSRSSPFAPQTPLVHRSYCLLPSLTSSSFLETRHRSVWPAFAVFFFGPPLFWTLFAAKLL